MSLLELSTSVGELSVRRFVVREAISSMFSASVWVRSPDPSLDLAGMIDQPATFRVAAASRAFRGLVVEAEQLHGFRIAEGRPGLSTYRVRIAPDLYRLTLRRGNRIYQHLSIPDIVESLLGEHGVSMVSRIDRGQYPKLEYKVQYGESDYAFFSRLLEEAGIAFTFPADEGGTLTLADHLESGPLRPGPPIPYIDHPEKVYGREFVTAVRLSREVRPGAFAIRDHELRNPDFTLYAEAQPAAGIEARNEQYHFDQASFLVETRKGGGTPVADDRGIARHDLGYGQGLAQRSLDGERVGLRGASFEASTIDLAPGVVFCMDLHPHPELPSGRRLLVQETEVQGSVDGELTLSGHAVFADAPYRPLRRTPKPVVHGVQSAVVVGPAGQEIHTDEFGRVRVQFPWDREGAHDEKSSCWMRVNEAWSGMGYGMIVLPRVGHEVFVGFAEGDPDLPFIMGRAFNAQQLVPYELPAHKTRSTWKSDSSPGSGGFNELMFEDLADEELVWQQGQKDRIRLVKNDERATVGHDRGKLVKNDESERTEGLRKRWVGKDFDLVTKVDKREEIDRDVSLVVKGSRREKIDGKQSLTVADDRQEKVGGRYALHAEGEAHYVAGEAIVEEAAQDFTLRGPGGFLRIDEGGVTIVGTLVKIQVSGSPGTGKGSHPDAPDRAKIDVLPHDGYFVVTEEGSTTPVAGQSYTITRESGEVIQGVTDSEGRTRVVVTDGAEHLELELTSDNANALRPKADGGP
jgi:type VI secretion system secreted protein VgrG